MKRDQLPLVTLDGRHAGELLAQPCNCGRLKCTIGSHIWESTRDMRSNGVKAQSYEPTGRATTESEIVAPDATERLHFEYRAAIQAYWHASTDLVRFIDRYRPDRWIELPPPATDEDWCRNHLAEGYCETRYRGDLCRDCYELNAEFGHLPDRDLMREIHEIGWKHPRALMAWRDRAPKPGRRKRKRAS